MDSLTQKWSNLGIINYVVNDLLLFWCEMFPFLVLNDLHALPLGICIIQEFLWYDTPIPKVMYSICLYLWCFWYGCICTRWALLDIVSRLWFLIVAVIFESFIPDYEHRPAIEKSHRAYKDSFAYFLDCVRLIKNGGMEKCRIFPFQHKPLSRGQGDYYCRETWPPPDAILWPI